MHLKRLLVNLALLVIGVMGSQYSSAANDRPLDPDNTVYKRMVTQGPATRIIETLYKCPVTVANHRLSSVGKITATDGTIITMPAETALQKGLGPSSANLYSECAEITPKNASEVSTKDVPLVVVDPDGEIITGYIVADNYYEMWVNGKLVYNNQKAVPNFSGRFVKRGNY